MDYIIIVAEVVLKIEQVQTVKRAYTFPKINKKFHEIIISLHWLSLEFHFI